MNRDPVTITRAEAIRRRREEEQRRREGQTRKRAVTPRPASAQAQTERPTLRLTPASSRLRRRYDISMSVPYGRSSRAGRTLEIPAIRIPPLTYGPRWVSFLILLACVGLIYAISTSDIYLVRQATIVGNQRIQADELEMAMGIWNQPSFTINPAQVEYNLLASYPELMSVQVQVALPAEIIVQVQERIPAIAWQQAGQTTWVDNQGYAFPPRGVAEGLAVVQAQGLPTLPANFDVNQVIGARPFMTPEMASAIMTLAPTMPEGASLVYDPEYGLGWQDPLGWQVYFGQRADNMPVKLNVYLSMVEYLLERGIQPELISVEFPSAPFYRMND
jgi:hypothetical protein